MNVKFLPIKAQGWRLICRLTIATLAGLASCDRASPFPDESLIRQDFEAFCLSENRPPKTFEIVDYRRWDRGTVALYEGMCGSPETVESDSPLFVQGYKVFRRRGLDWRAIGAGSLGRKAEFPETDQPIDYSIGYAIDQGYVIVEGRVYSSEVTAVEAVFDDGTVLRDRGERDRFAIVAAKASQVCELRVLGANEQVIASQQIAQNCEADPQQGCAHHCSDGSGSLHRSIHNLYSHPQFG